MELTQDLSLNSYRKSTKKGMEFIPFVTLSNRDVAWVLLSYNHPQLTQRAVLSLLRNKPIEIEDENIFLVHNGSQSQFVQSLKKEFPQLTHLVLDNNRGYSGGCNFGLQMAFRKKPWAFVMTNDCELVQWPIERQILKGELEDFEQLESHALILNHSIVAPLILARNGQKVDSLGGELHLSRGRALHLKERRAGTELCSPSKVSDDLQIYVPGSAYLIPRDIFYSLEGFDESLGTYWEDIDLSLRAQLNGYRISTSEEIQVIHKIGKTCHKDPLYTLFYYQRNRKRISRKYVPSLWGRICLELNLVQDWFRLFLSLFKKNRWRDMKYLFFAILK